MKHKQRHTKDQQRPAEADSDEEVDDFTKLFMSKVKHQGNQYEGTEHVSCSSSRPAGAFNKMSPSEDDSASDEDDLQRARNRMSPSEDDSASDEDDFQRARNRMSPSEDYSASDEDDFQRARNRMSPSEDDSASDEDDFQRARNRMSPSEDDSASDEDDFQRARNRMSPSEDSASDEDDFQRARNKMSPSEDDSESVGDDVTSGARVNNQSERAAGRAKKSLNRRPGSVGSNSNATNAKDSCISKESDNVSDCERTRMSGSQLISDSENSCESDSESSSSETPVAQKPLREELADISFEDLQKLKEKIGVKAFKSAMGNSQSGTSTTGKFKRANKNRPMEMSSKKPVARLREVVPVKKKVKRDPRFDDLSGQYHEHFFSKAYGFISDLQQREKQVLTKKMKKEKNEEKRKQMKYLVTRMTQQENAAKAREIRQEREREIKKKEERLIQGGKVPFHLKKSDRKTLELAEKFRELKKSGKVEKYLAKKRKKNAQKEKRKLPLRPAIS